MSLIKVPIVLMVFKRLDTTKTVFEQIRKAQPEKLYIISDGARKGNAEEEKKVQAVRDFLDTSVDWNCNVIKDYANQNMGSRYRIVTGLDKVFEKEECAIIVEDDIVAHDTFFEFCQEMLIKYKDDERIGMITGCNMCPDYKSEYDYFFTKIVENWGWATWKRAWKTYDSDVKGWEKIAKEHYLAKYFGNKVYEKEILGGLDAVVNKGLDAWDCQWVYNMAVHSQYSIMPAKNLVYNIGFDSNEATHTKEKSRFVFADGKMEFPMKEPVDVRQEWDYDHMFIKRNYDYGKLKKLYLMAESFVTIHMNGRRKND